MKVGYAPIMDNWFPGTEKVTLRRGSAEHVTGLGASVETLMPYNALSGTPALFGVAGGSIYNVTTSGAVGAAVSTGYTNSRFQHVQIGTSGGQFLFAVNGEDAPISFDGTTWANPSITASGFVPADTIWCNLHQNRLWFGAKNSLDTWYLPVRSIAGTCVVFPLASVAQMGGYVMAMGTWTRDGGDGTDDVAVFLTSEGEAILYQGTDPSSASTWALIGVFRIGKPIGRRCMIKAGADLIMVTQDGFVAASSILSLDRSQAQKVALSEQINKSVNDAVSAAGSTFGWQPFLYPKGTMLIFNVPTIVAGTYHQYVFNTITGAPARFTGMNAICWGMLGDNAYFGGADGTVYLSDTGASDNGSAINGDVLPAFDYFGSPGMVKRFGLVEPIFQSEGNPNAAIDLNIDFQIAVPTGVPSASPVNSARWGVSRWGIGVWGSALQIYKGWRGVRGIGRSASLRIRVSSTTSRPSLVATNFSFTRGGIL
jgi:hypothetical protein